MLAGWHEGEEGRPDRLLVNFFGLFGPDGPLPLHMTEYARDRMRNERDPTLQRFADLFHHRALSLMYRAWADVRPAVSFDRPDTDRFATYVGALAGLGMPTLRDRDAMPDLTKLHFAGLLANQTRHADGLAAILTAFFTMPVQVETFVGSWLDLPVSDHTRLDGTPGSTRRWAAAALLGARVWSRSHKFRLVFGPLALEDYERLLPGGSSFHKLVPIVANYAGDDAGLGRALRAAPPSGARHPPRPVRPARLDHLAQAAPDPARRRRPAAEREFADSMARKTDSRVTLQERELA